MSRFSEIIKRDNLSFDYEVYDVVSLSDGTRAIITDYGIYDNQYWCEFPESRSLGVADWCVANSKAYGRQILSKINEPQTVRDIQTKYLNKLIEMKEDFSIKDDAYNKEITRVKLILK